MKKKILLLVAVSACMLSLFGFQADNDWQVYSSSDGHFSVAFPGKPEESTQDDKTADGIPFKIHFATYSPTDNEVYMAGWINMDTFYPADKTMKEILEDSRDGATGSMKATSVTTLATELSDKPYIEFTFELDGFVGKDRIYVINKVQYSLITIFAKGSGLNTSADRFIMSFKSL